MLYGFICISLVIHFFIFLHIAGIYQSRAVSYIELTLHQFSKPDVRHIPKPRPRYKAPEISNVQRVRARNFTVPKFKIETVKAVRIDHTYEKINMPDLPGHGDISGLSVPGFPGGNPAGDVEPHLEQVEFTSAEEYLEMLNLRIHSAKKYPESAKSRHLEGRVKVEFTLQTDGSLSGIKVIKSSRHRNLDDAAVQAVRNASPFPRPPSFIFNEAITLRVNILFELA